MNQRFSTDDEIPEDGIYYVYHEAHRLIRSVLLLKGDKFPRCSQCAGHVVFEMMFPVDLRAYYEPMHLFELPLRDEDETGMATGS